MRYGIELEYWTIDSEGTLASAGDLPTRFDFVEGEAVESLIELKTPPCDSPAELRDALADRLDRVRSAAAEADRRLVPLGTPLSRIEPSYRSRRRIRIQREVFGEDFRHACCAGTHLHVEQTDAVDQFNLLTALDPAVALVTTAGYFDGERVGACARPAVYRRRCYRRCPGLGRLWRYVDDRETWRRRVRERYWAFHALAERAGVDTAAVESAFDPETTVWSPVRIRDDLGTVEWRAPDATLPSHALRLVADLDRLCGALADRTVEIDGGRPGLDEDERLLLPRFDRLRELTDAAVESGLADSRVRRYLRRFGFDPGAYEPLAREFDPGEAVPPARARRIRRRAADRLDRDAERLRERTGEGAAPSESDDRARVDGLL